MPRVTFLMAVTTLGGAERRAWRLGERLYSAARDGDVKLSASLIKAKADLDYRGSFGNTPLIVAASKGYLSVARVLISAGADVHIKEYACRARS